MAKRIPAIRKAGTRTLEVSNLDKVLFPDDGITKGDILDYYDAICGWMLPHLKNRPLVLQRYPDGIARFGFYQKQASEHFPDWIGTVRVKKEGGWQDLVVCNDRATLLYLANQAALTLHPWLSRADRIHCPDVLVVDLDPPSGQFEQARSAARCCKKIFDEMEAPVFLKTTGSKGLHLVVPLTGKDDFDVVRAFARDLMDLLAARYPDELTVEHRKANRRGRLYLDIARNAYAQTAVSAYSVRALPGAPVSAPIEWDELRRKSLDSRTYTIRNVLRHVEAGDPWAELRRRRCSPATMRKRLAELTRGGRLP
ncbi:MAG TPA: non-homologous end-joining DNA ligase [Candidatus Limnocylindrales bacterium]|nr:non-homologous end-joining DNA ligase [Candidatus Limnocylindrales bacterium]